MIINHLVVLADSGLAAPDGHRSDMVRKKVAMTNLRGRKWMLAATPRRSHPQSGQTVKGYASQEVKVFGDIAGGARRPDRRQDSPGRSPPTGSWTLPWAACWSSWRRYRSLSPTKTSCVCRTNWRVRRTGIAIERRRYNETLQDSTRTLDCSHNMWPVWSGFTATTPTSRRKRARDSSQSQTLGEQRVSNRLPRRHSK